MPIGRRYNGLPVPGWFQEESADALRHLQMHDDDVVLASLPKSGTTWVQKILYLMLHGLDDDGLPTGQPSLHAKGQVYPDALPLKRPAGPPPAEGPEAFRRKAFGDAGFEDLVSQPAPRLFSTHLPRGFLPAELEAADGRGRLIVVARNLKDVLTSLHFFRGEAKDGWLGNEHGPGSLARFVAAECPNAFGSSLGWLKEMDALVGALLPAGRALVLYYEDLSRSLPAQLERLAAFLGVRLSPAKKAAMAEGAGFGAIAVLGAVVFHMQDQHAVLGHPRARNPFQALLDRVGQGASADIKAELHRALGLVHMLAARPGRADEAFGDQAFINAEIISNAHVSQRRV